MPTFLVRSSNGQPEPSPRPLDHDDDGSSSNMPPLTNPDPSRQRSRVRLPNDGGSMTDDSALTATVSDDQIGSLEDRRCVTRQS